VIGGQRVHKEIDMSPNNNVPQDPKKSPASATKKPAGAPRQPNDQLRNERSPADLEREEANRDQPSGWTTKM
jgi:hypothetical protein